MCETRGKQENRLSKLNRETKKDMMEYRFKKEEECNQETGTEMENKK